MKTNKPLYEHGSPFAAGCAKRAAARALQAWLVANEGKNVSKYAELRTKLPEGWYYEKIVYPAIPGVGRIPRTPEWPTYILRRGHPPLPLMPRYRRGDRPATDEDLREDGEDPSKYLPAIEPLQVGWKPTYRRRFRVPEWLQILSWWAAACGTFYYIVEHFILGRI